MPGIAGYEIIFGCEVCKALNLISKTNGILATKTIFVIVQSRAFAGANSVCKDLAVTTMYSPNIDIEILYAPVSKRLTIPKGIGGKPIRLTSLAMSFSEALTPAPEKHLITLGDAASIRRAAKSGSGSGRTI